MLSEEQRYYQHRQSLPKNSQRFDTFHATEKLKSKNCFRCKRVRKLSPGIMQGRCAQDKNSSSTRGTCAPAAGTTAGQLTQWITYTGRMTQPGKHSSYTKTRHRTVRFFCSSRWVSHFRHLPRVMTQLTISPRTYVRIPFTVQPSCCDYTTISYLSCKNCIYNRHFYIRL